MEAISAEQAGRLDDIYQHRHQMTHELIKYVIDPEIDPDVDLFIDALKILKSVRQFWISVETGFGTFGEDVRVEDVLPLSLMILQQCIDAYIGGQTPCVDEHGEAEQSPRPDIQG